MAHSDVWRSTQRHWLRGCTALLLVLLALLGAGPARAAGFFVNSTQDERDANPGDGSCLSTPSRPLHAAGRHPGGQRLGLASPTRSACRPASTT